MVDQEPDLERQGARGRRCRAALGPVDPPLAAIPELTKRLADDIQWTTDLGNAFLAQQSDVMDAVQRMRKKAQAKGALASNQQQKVETKIVETKEVIVVVPAKPEVVYVPVYSPTVVYGPPVYPYPPVYYPPYTPGAAFVTFGVGVLVGAAIWGGTCCGCGWGHGHGNVTINNFNNFNRNTNINRDVNRNGNGNGNGRRAAATATGSTTPHTEVARRTPTGPPRPNTAVRRAATRPRTASNDPVGRARAIR